MKFLYFRRPKVSVIIATYNWIEALQHSLKSAMQQSIRNIEIIVVSDGCSDETIKYISNIKDSRVRLLHLKENSGSQAFPNNAGIKAASADFIAYLGHDDIWYPNHLETLLATQLKSNADFIGSGAILYGPPDTNIRMTTGFPCGGSPQRMHFLPPSTIMHRKSIVEKIGYWQDPATIDYPVDYDFQLRAWDAGFKFATTNQITVFKFPSVWWRDSYKRKDVSRQQAILKKIAIDPHLIEHELIDVVKAAEEGSLIQTQPLSKLKKGHYYLINNEIRGLKEKQFEKNEFDKEIIFTLEPECYAFEWHCLEQNPEGKSFRWSGPRTESTIDIPIDNMDCDLKLTIHILYVIYKELLADIQLFINGQSVPFTKQINENHTYDLICHIPKEKIVVNKIRITIKISNTLSPFQINPILNTDRRRLGVAVNCVKINNV